MEAGVRQFLTSSDLFRTACRASFFSTFDGMLCRCLADRDVAERSSGFLDNIPLLRGCAPQIQLELLLCTWGSVTSTAPTTLNIVEQCVCYAALTELTELVTAGNHRDVARAGQRSEGSLSDDVLWLPSKLRAIQVTLPFAAQAAVLAPESSLASSELEAIRLAGGVSREGLAELLALTGRWRMDTSTLACAETLLTDRERQVLREFLDEFPQVMLPRKASS